MKRTIEVEVYLQPYGEYVMVIPSGFVGHKIAIAEDPAYNLSIWYPTEEELKTIIETDERVRKERKEYDDSKKEG